MQHLDQILDIQNLTLKYQSKEDEVMILDDLHFTIPRGKVTGITGESGSGKSLTALSLLGLTTFFPTLDLSGSVLFENKNILRNTDKEWRNIRGKKISLIMQQPESALNPLVRCGQQLLEVMTAHQKDVSKAILISKAESLLKKVGLHDTKRIYNAYAHQLSGGQMQRILIAMAIANDPEVIIADEITASLDISTSRDIIKLLLELKNELNTTLIFITHDIALLRQISDQIILLHHGRVKDQFLNTNPLPADLKTYTKDYLSYSFANDEFRNYAPDNEDQEILKASEITKEFVKKLFWGFGKMESKCVLKNVHLTVRSNEMLGVLGESGSGKTTLGKIITGLLAPTSGSLWYRDNGYDLQSFESDTWLRKQMQIIFQDASTSMNPKITIGKQIEEVIRLYKIATGNENIKAKLEELCHEMSVPVSCLSRFPHEISGGQRQRMVLARTLLLKPDLIIFDESLSALDMKHQHLMMDLILSVQKKYAFAGIFISHDPVLIKYLCTHVMIMDQGEVIESGEVEKVFIYPTHAKTRELMEIDW